MVYHRTPHRSPETETPLLPEIIAEAVLNAETCHANGRFFCGSPVTCTILTDADLDQALLHIARDYGFLYDADPESIFAELSRRFAPNQN